jgi:hypothetical protein
MGLLTSLRNINKRVLGNSLGSAVSNAGQFAVKAHTYGFSNSDKYSLLGQYSQGQDAKAAAEAKAKQQQQTQLDLLTAQENAAQNALADLTLKNTPDVIAGGTADALLGLKKRKTGAAATSISTQLGLGA